MPCTRFASLELRYGCHEGRAFRFTEKPMPVVIAGPNGAGKSTLLEAAVRTLFGFDRRQVEDRNCVDHRRPRVAGAFRSKLVTVDAAGMRWAIERDFETSDVELRQLQGGEVWRGDGNPGATNVEAMEYRRRLAGLFGHSERSHYEYTACIHQGKLGETRLTDGLLRAAAGGHTNVEAAKSHLYDPYRRLTQQPLRPGDRAAIKPREFEEVQARITASEAELRQAEEAQRRRGPLLAEQAGLRNRIDELAKGIDVLEKALRPLAERRALDVEHEQLDKQVAALERARLKLTDAIRSFETAKGTWDTVSAEGPRYPDDFPERLAALGPLWEAKERLEDDLTRATEAVQQADIPRWALPAAVGCAAGSAGVGLTMALLGWEAIGVVVIVIGLLAATGLIFHRRRAAEARAHRQASLNEHSQRLEDLQSRLRQRLKDVPDANTLTPSTAAERRSYFERQRDAASALGLADTAIAREVAETRQLLDGADGNPDDPDRPLESARALLTTLDEQITRSRNALAEKRLELRRSGAESIDLPSGVEPDAGTVEGALEHRRRELNDSRERFSELERQLVELGSDVGNPVALRDQLRTLRQENSTIEGKVEAHRAAYVLLCDAYDEFRERDQERLIELISGHIGTLSGGALGPLEAAGTLEAATVASRGIRVPLTVPPLSFGEYHCMLLAIRLGATDFLATAGIRPPLIVDDPFVHLDEAHAASVWRLLCTISQDRQVIVATQDRLILDHLGVTPDIVLAPPPPVPDGE